MEKQVNKIICDNCMGNGYIRINTSSYDEVVQCQKCNSQGEITSIENIDDVRLPV
jgi:DnaJ-class molecular chaperone